MKINGEFKEVCGRMYYIITGPNTYRRIPMGFPR
jgi:hypothetical protein